MFWAYGPFSKLELICVNSFIRHGYGLNIWTYRGLTNAPQGAALRDARKILPESRVFTYKNGSYAGYSNLFRYTLLSRVGGLYIDTDVICLTPAAHLPDGPFVVSERSREGDGSKVNCNVIFSPRPEAGDIIDLAYSFTNRFPVDKLEWSDCGPKLLTLLTRNYPSLAFPVKDADFANSIDFWRCPDALLEPGRQISEGAAFLHLYNQMWTWAGVDKNAPYPKGSLMDRFAERYL
jgi:hypothetical protein